MVANASDTWLCGTDRMCWGWALFLPRAAVIVAVGSSVRCFLCLGRSRLRLQLFFRVCGVPYRVDLHLPPMPISDPGLTQCFVLRVC